DGTIDLAILRFKTDQIGKGMDYTGLHHFGILVDDLDDVAKKVAAHGGEHYMDQSEPERVGGFETKMYGPEGVLFDIAEHPWTGTEPLPESVKEAADYGGRHCVADGDRLAALEMTARPSSYCEELSDKAIFRRRAAAVRRG